MYSIKNTWTGTTLRHIHNIQHCEEHHLKVLTRRFISFMEVGSFLCVNGDWSESPAGWTRALTPGLDGQRVACMF